jgi:hypothetical protein
MIEALFSLLGGGDGLAMIFAGIAINRLSPPERKIEQCWQNVNSA